MSALLDSSVLLHVQLAADDCSACDAVHPGISQGRCHHHTWPVHCGEMAFASSLDLAAVMSHTQAQAQALSSSFAPNLLLLSVCLHAGSKVTCESDPGLARPFGFARGTP